jgi:uncharacterized membrane protein
LRVGWLIFFGQPIATLIAPALVTVFGTVIAIAYKFISNVTNIAQPNNSLLTRRLRLS